jgi:hypothetical protein
MNNILQLKGQFQQRSNQSGFGQVNLPKNAEVSATHIGRIRLQLEQIKEYWKRDKAIGGALISAHYSCIVAKSNRIQSLLREMGSNTHPNDSIRGAKFIDGKNKSGKLVKKHVFTYFISYEALNRAIDELIKCERIVGNYYSGSITNEKTQKINAGDYHSKDLSKSKFLRTIVDTYYIEQFQIDIADKKIEEQSIITIYKTGIGTIELLSSFGIDMINAKMIDETTLRLDPDEIQLLQNNASYLIAMHVKNFAEIVLDDVEKIEGQGRLTIPPVGNEPIIGVIDTQFDESVYFSEFSRPCY